MKVMKFCQKHNISLSFKKDQDTHCYVFNFKKDEKGFEVYIPFYDFLDENKNIDQKIIDKLKSEFKISEE